MALVDAIRAGVRVADTVTQSLQVQVWHTPFQDADWKGKGADVQPVLRACLIEASDEKFEDAEGRIVQVQHRLTFLSSFPITMRDRLEMHDGRISGSIVRIDGMQDPAGGYLTPPIVFLGRMTTV